jgi:hypothetical protein
MVDIDWASVLTALTATAGIGAGIIGVAAFLGNVRLLGDRSPSNASAAAIID